MINQGNDVNATRCQAITDNYAGLKIAVVGDFCLDRYLEIDPALVEISIETGLPVHNVVNVRSQPGAAGTILNNLVALGVGALYPVGFAGDDGEGYELIRSLQQRQGVRLEHFFQTPERRTFTYTKPLVVSPGKTPVELNRLDLKNWSSTPASVEAQMIHSVSRLAAEVDAIILMDQVDVAETGVVTSNLLRRVGEVARERPGLLILADSRRGLKDFPEVCLKMNRRELSLFFDLAEEVDLHEIQSMARALAASKGRCCFITLAEQGILGASPAGECEHIPSLPLRGEIDIVGAGDSITANLTASLAAGAGLRESLELANAAASIVIHQLGTTGTASVAGIRDLIGSD